MGARLRSIEIFVLDDRQMDDRNSLFGERFDFFQGWRASDSSIRFFFVVYFSRLASKRVTYIFAVGEHCPNQMAVCRHDFRV